MLSALESWVEKGIAPSQVIASHLTNGTVDRTRPLCPFPKVALYTGKGSTDQAANFVCRNLAAKKNFDECGGWYRDIFMPLGGF